MKCESCTKEVSWKIAQASMNRFRKCLCIEHQIEEIKKTYPKALAEMSIKQLEKYI
jgi:hypothetical protein